MKKSQLSLAIFAAIVANDIMDTIAQIFMKKGLSHGSLSEFTVRGVFHFVAVNGASPLLWLGISAFALNFFIWIIILYKVDLSIAMPVGSTSYLFIPLCAIIFLHERISPLRWVGILFIVAGIHFVCRSKKEVAED